MEKIVTYFKLAGAGICTALVGLLGEWDVALKILVLIVGLDILTGILKAIYTKQLNSQKAWKGGIKKIGIFVIVSLGVAIDQFTNMQLFRSCAIGYFIATEGLSIIENWGSMDLPLPEILKNVLVQIKEQSNSGKNKLGDDINDTKSKI